MLGTAIRIEILGNEVEVDVDYSVFGNDIPANYVEPAEYAELEISSISRFVNGEHIDITEMFTDKEREKIEEILHESLCEG